MTKLQNHVPIKYMFFFNFIIKYNEQTNYTVTFDFIAFIMFSTVIIGAKVFFCSFALEIA